MSGESVKVVVRCRPMNQREKDLKSEVSRFEIVNIRTFFLIINISNINLNFFY